MNTGGACACPTDKRLKPSPVVDPLVIVCLLKMVVVFLEPTSKKRLFGSTLDIKEATGGKSTHQLKKPGKQTAKYFPVLVKIHLLCFSMLTPSISKST